MYTRYAIYVTPSGPLAAAGAAWLGWDIATGQAVSHPPLDGIDLAAATSRPRKYGLHATIKPPMAMADGLSREALVDAAGAVAERIAPIALESLEVTRIGRFFALTPAGDQTALMAMAAKVVETLDHFRHPPTLEHLARHRQRPLTASQEHNLTKWGYPNVMADFNFHITLTGPLKDVEAVRPLIAAYFAPVLPAPFVIDHLTVAGEDAAGMFHTIAQLPLGG